eukprot:19104-Heterococcus_DN1.PRE.3
MRVRGTGSVQGGSCAASVSLEIAFCAMCFKLQNTALLSAQCDAAAEAAAQAAEAASRMLELEGYSDAQAYTRECAKRDRESLAGRRAVAQMHKSLDLAAAVMEAELAEEELRLAEILRADADACSAAEREARRQSLAGRRAMQCKYKQLEEMLAAKREVTALEDKALAKADREAVQAFKKAHEDRIRLSLQKRREPQLTRDEEQQQQAGLSRTTRSKAREAKMAAIQAQQRQLYANSSTNCSNSLGTLETELDSSGSEM